MKHLRRYTALICMFLVLCMLPAVAGATRLDKEELHFTVGKKDSQDVYALREGNEPGVIFDRDSFINRELPRLTALGLSFDYESVAEGVRFTFSGTPLIAGEHELVFGISNSEKGMHYVRELKIIIHEKQQATPSSSPVVDDVVYNAAAYHEQALIRGVREWCNVRAGAGTQHEIVGRANAGQQISLLCWNEDESWCYVEFDGTEGWIAKQFILPIQ